MWRDEPETLWLARLQEEVLELGLALRGEHEHLICLNWLEMRTSAPEGQVIKRNLLRSATRNPRSAT